MTTELQQKLTELRIQYGTTTLYKTLLGLLRSEYEELHELFGGMVEGTFSNGISYYNEFMELSTKAANETLEEQCYSLNVYDMESVGASTLDDIDDDLDVDDDLDLEIDVGCETLSIKAEDEECNIKVIHTHVAEPDTPIYNSEADDINVKEIKTEKIVYGKGAKRIVKKKN